MVLTYENRKVVLMYLDANLRIQLSARAPSLRTIDKIMQLKIDRLVLNKNIIIINDTSYKLALFRNYHAETPEYADYKNRIGGYTNDQDEYGIDRIGREDDAIDGHVTVNLHHHHRRRVDREETPVDQIIDALQNQTRSHVRYSMNVYENISKLEFQMKIRLELEDYQNKRDNRRPNFMHYVQLTIGERPFERLTYTRRLYEYHAGLLNFLFKNRREKVLVKHFEVGYPCVYHFPNDVKFKVQEMEVNKIFERDWVLKQFKPVMDETRPALRRVKTLSTRSDTNYIFNILQSVLNKSIHLNDASNFTVRDYTQIANEWMTHGKEVGTTYRFGVQWLNKVNQFFFKLQSLYPQAIVADGDSRIAIPLNNGTAFVTYYTYDRGNRSWILSFEMISIL